MMIVTKDQRNREPSISIVASINIDVVLRAERPPRRGESFVGADYRYVPGGKGANQAIAASRLGAKVSMVGRVGPDTHGSRMKTLLKSEGVSIRSVSTENALP